MATTGKEPAILLETSDETRLVADVCAGSEAAFERLVRTYGGKMLAVIRRLLRNEEDASDALQEALLSAYRSMHGFSGASRLSTWLHRIAVNSALMKLRSRRGRPEQPIEDLLPRFLEDGHQARPAAPWRESAEAAAQRRETRELVLRCIDKLPESYRTVLLLRDIEELDTEETARLSGLTPSAVKTRLHRARQALRSLLDPHFRGDAV